MPSARLSDVGQRHLTSPELDAAEDLHAIADADRPVFSSRAASWSPLTTNAR